MTTSPETALGAGGEGGEGPADPPSLSIPHGWGAAAPCGAPGLGPILQHGAGGHGGAGAAPLQQRDLPVGSQIGVCPVGFAWWEGVKCLQGCPLVPEAEAGQRGTANPALRCRDPVPEQGPSLSLLICVTVAATLLQHG